jgi:serine/threonine protein kinase
MILNGIPLSSEGSVKIVDFGIAKFAQHDDGEVQALTKTGEIFGSPLYMSPEQCSGEHVDYRSDIYSLGCVLFEALTGTPLSGVNMFCLQRQFKFAIDMTVISA